MRILPAALLLAAALPTAARANPMLDKCLPFAPAACGLSEASSQDDFLSCLKAVKLDAGQPAQAACAEELAHARVHKACAPDIAALCAGVKPGNNRTMTCLRRRVKKAAPACREALGAYDLIAPPAGERKKGRGGAGVSAVRC